MGFFTKDSIARLESELDYYEGLLEDHPKDQEYEYMVNKVQNELDEEKENL